MTTSPKASKPVVAMMLRVPPELVVALREQAKAERRTMSSVAAYAILSYIDYAKDEAERRATKRPAATHRSNLKGLP
jgi:predicted transcriptional regulator